MILLYYPFRPPKVRTQVALSSTDLCGSGRDSSQEGNYGPVAWCVLGGLASWFMYPCVDVCAYCDISAFRPGQKGMGGIGGGTKYTRLYGK